MHPSCALVSDIAVFVLTRDVKLQPTNPSCALLGGLLIGARVALLWQHSANAKCQRVHACTRSMPSFQSPTSAATAMSSSYTMYKASDTSEHRFVHHTQRARSLFAS